MSIIGKIRKINKQINMAKAYDTPLKTMSTWAIFLDYIVSHYRYGVSFTKYEQYEFYRLNNKGKESFVGERYGEEIYNICNPASARSITGDKSEFNKRFAAFLHRRFLDAENASFEEFCDFVNSVDKYISKPFYGASGKGIEIIINDGSLPLEKLYQQYKSEKCTLEEVVRQHSEMAALHPESVNTMRIATILHDDVYIMGAALRIGTGKEVVDNFHKHGIVACIDIETGIVKSTGVNFEHQRFIIHPDTGKQIVGFVIPNWEAVVATVKKAARALPEMKYVGWDVAIDYAGNVLLIEGNSIPDYDVLQIASQEGLYYKYKPLIDKIQAEKK